VEDISTSGIQYLDLRILGGLIERVLAVGYARASDI